VELPKLVVSPGVLKLAYEYELERFRETNTLKRFWQKDMSLWPRGEPRSAASAHQLDWLEPPRDLEGYARRAASAAEGVGKEFDDVVFIAQGSSNLAAEIVPSMGLFTHEKRFFILDSVHPTDIQRIEDVADLHRTLFLLASKTGKLIETHGLFLHFSERLKILGSPYPGRNFVAVTEEDSYLRDLAAEYHFRSVFVDPAGYPSRFSGVIHFTLVLSGVCGRNPDMLLEKARAMRAACESEGASLTHPALSLAAFLSAGAENGHERFAILTHSATSALAHRVEQLVGTNTCGGGRGIVPLTGAGEEHVGAIRGKHMAAVIRLRGIADPKLDRAEDFLRREGIPATFVELEGVEDFGAEVYRWEIATCLASSALEVNPFEARAMEAGRVLAMEYLDRKASGREPALTKARLQQEGIELHLEGRTRHEISMLNLTEALRSLFSRLDENSYLAILSFLPNLGEVAAILQKLCERMEAKLRVPVLLNHGPRYLHISGQSFKAGPPKGIFLMLTEEIEKDICVPGAEYGFGDLVTALALSDFESLTQSNRTVARVHMKHGATAGVEQLRKILDQALIGFRRSG
jgi:glucose-6-phosphate isomerase